MTFLINFFLIVLIYGTVHGSEEDLRCYVCSSYMEQCRTTVTSQTGYAHRGRCYSKCFVRLGEDGALYRGCFDGFEDVPFLTSDYDGCKNQTWNGQTLPWCFCDGHLCNQVSMKELGYKGVGFGRDAKLVKEKKFDDKKYKNKPEGKEGGQDENEGYEIVDSPYAGYDDTDYQPISDYNAIYYGAPGYGGFYDYNYQVEDPSVYDEKRTNSLNRNTYKNSRESSNERISSSREDKQRHRISNLVPKIYENIVDQARNTVNDRNSNDYENLVDKARNKVNDRDSNDNEISRNYQPPRSREYANEKKNERNYANQHGNSREYANEMENDRHYANQHGNSREYVNDEENETVFPTHRDRMDAGQIDYVYPGRNPEENGGADRRVDNYHSEENVQAPSRVYQMETVYSGPEKIRDSNRSPVRVYEEIPENNHNYEQPPNKPSRQNAKPDDRSERRQEPDRPRYDDDEEKEQYGFPASHRHEPEPRLNNDQKYYEDQEEHDKDKRKKDDREKKEQNPYYFPPHLAKQIECAQTGFYQNPDDCRTFVACILDAHVRRPYMHLMRCPDGLVWDNTDKICNQYSSTCNVGGVDKKPRGDSSNQPKLQRKRKNEKRKYIS